MVYRFEHPFVLFKAKRTTGDYNGLVEKDDSFVILNETAFTNISLHSGHDIFVLATFMQPTIRHFSLFERFFEMAERELQNTKQINGYTILVPRTLDLLWLSEYDFNNMMGSYDYLKHK